MTAGMITVRGVREPPHVPVHPALRRLAGGGRFGGEWIAECGRCRSRSLAMRVPGPPRDTWPEITIAPGEVYYALDVLEITLPIGWRVVDGRIVELVLRRVRRLAPHVPLERDQAGLLPARRRVLCPRCIEKEALDG